MPFPHSDRVIFSHNPLAEVVCELRFPPVLRIASELPAAFQESIRRDYPVFQQAQAIPNQLIVGGPSQGNVTIQQPNLGFGWPQPSFVFVTEAGTRTVTLTAESLSIAERDYTRWEHLRAELDRLKALLEDIYEPPFYARIGLRYQDLLDRQALAVAGTTWQDLLNPAFAGIFGSESSVASDVSRITSVVEIRLADVPGGQVRIQHGLIDTPAGQKLYAIDSDFSINERTKAENVLPALDGFNSDAGDLFRWAISDRLLAALEPLPVPDLQSD